MIPAITEVNFPSYATLSQATVSLQEMGDRTISSQIKIDGDVVPSFDGWELRFKGERFILPVKEPQAAKDNSSRRSVIDLSFQSWSVFQMKRYFFVSMSQIDAGTAIPDQYNASVILPIEGFVQLFNKVLQYYFGDAIRMDLFGAGTPGLYSQEPVVVEINKTYIWDVLVKFYELFGYRWRIEYDSVSGAHVIKVNYTAPAITDHDFEYGYQGGLLKFERQVQDTNISNVLIGRGGEKNLPYRYFKLQDPNNTAFAPDPDAIPELANIYFDRLRDANFRWYVRGWMQNENRDTSWDATHTFPTYTDADCPEPFLFAFHRGQTDEKFNPIEYVKDDASIAKYGERWGAVEDNDDAYPTIQGREVTGLGRVDEVVDVSPIVTDDIDEASRAAATYIEVAGTKTVTNYFGANGEFVNEFRSEQFSIPEGQVGNIQYSLLNPYNGKTGEEYPAAVIAMELLELKAVNVQTGVETAPEGLTEGSYYLRYRFKGKNYTSVVQTYATYGFNSLRLVLSSADADAWKPTFDIWVKNIWQSEQLSGESDEDYARRVWEPILGDRAGNEARVVFSTGFMSTSQDYEFVIAAYPVKDRSKTITSGGVNYDSEWKITLRKSDVEFEATGLYIPNATTGGAPAAGDHFFFIGIDMPFQYVVWGEEFLNGALNTPVVNKTAALENLADINPSWIIQLDKVRCNTHEGTEYGQHLADRLSAGATVNIRDVRFTGGQVLTLYVQSINYVWNEPTDNNPYLVPDIEVVLSDKVVATEGTVTRVSNELEIVKTTYAKSADIEQVVRSIGNALFLKKTGESDRSASPTSFASAVNSADFRPGDFGGAGWGHYEDSDGNSVLEVDTVIARKGLRVNSLVANQVAYIGGKSIRSAASIKCTQVVEDDGYYYCYFDQKQGSVANLFLVGDFAMGQDFDENNAETRYYRMSVAGVGVDYIKLAKSGRDGQGAPMKGDTIVQYGHGSDASRQYVIVEDVIGGGYQRMLSGLNTVSASGKEYYFAGRQPSVGERWFVGDINGEHAEWKNGQLNITGRLSVRDINGNYQAMDTYMSGVSQSIANLQAQIDGQIQSWASGEAPTPQTEPLPKIDGGTVDPSTANFPASGWANNTEREKHVGDIYVDDSTGQGYRYTKRVNNGVTEYYWIRITDEELAQALADIQALQQQYAGLEYLKTATNNGTLVQGGLVLTSLIQLGYTASNVFNVMSGINGVLDTTLSDQTKSIAAWYGGPMVDHEADHSAANYAKSLFRFDGSGYLAGGNIFWNKLGYGGIPGITWNGSDIIIGGNVKLASLTGDSVTELLSLVRELSSLIEKVNIGTQANPVYAVHVKDGMGFYSDSFVDAGGVGSGGGGGGGGDLDVNTMYINLANGQGTDPLYYTREINVSHLHEFWKSLQNNDIVSTYDNYKIAGTHIPDMAETYGYLKSADIDAYLQSLQSQIDSVAARTNFDDLVVTSLFSDVASISSLYAETIYLGGTSIASSLSSLSTAISNEATARANADSGLSTAISNEATARANADSALSSAIDGVASRATTLEGYFDANGNAKSALKLTTVSKTIWGQTYWTSGGVPQNVTAAPNLYIGGSKVQTSQAAQVLVGISSISAVVSPGSDDNTKIEWDANANAWHFHGGIYADTFVTAGGEWSGGSVPTTLDAVWNTLRYNTGDYQDVQIDVAHIPGLPWSKIISGKPSSLAGYGILDAYTKTEVDNLIGAIDQFHYEIYPSLSDITTPAGNVLYLIGPTGSGSDKYEEYVYANGSFTKIGDTTIDLSAYLTIASAQATYQPIISDLATIRTQAGHGETAYNSLDTISDCLQSLQSQIDSVATRNDFDELNASSVFSDIVAATSLYVGSLALDGNDLATTLSNLSGRIGTVEGKFTGDSANSALRLAGTSAYSIWGVEYWSSGVPKFVTGRPGLFIGSTQVQTSSATQDLAGIGSITATGALTLSSTKKIYFGDSTHYIELDADGYFHFSHGLYSEGFVTAGGQGTGGGGGGVDLERVWQSLTNNTDFPDVKINVAHIPDMANVYGYLKGNQTITLTGVVTGSGTTSIATSIANNALSIAMVNGLQAALDSKTSNVGTVTSVGLSMPTGFSVSGTPITASGTFSVSFASGYSLLTSAQASTWNGKQDAISDLATIRSNASNGNTAYGWGNHTNAGYFAASSFTASNIVSTLGNTAVNRATADAAGENIASNFTTVGNALKSLQSQIDSVASRSVYDELTATNLYSDMAVGVSAYFSNFYGNLTGTASNATNADNADKLDGVHASGLFTELTTSAGSTNLYITIGGTRLSKTIYAYYDSDGGIIASNMTTIGTALRSLQSQIDSVATNRSFDEISITSAFADMLSVGSNVNVGGTIHSIGGIDSNSYITAGAAASSSDARLKTDIKEISAERALQLLSTLKGKEWTWNDKKEYLAGKHGSGLIAQEVIPVMPWAVLDLNGEYSLNYNTLWGVAIPVMQSHEQRIEALERENKELKHKIEILTNNS